MYTLWISAWPLKHCETGSICRAEKLINAGFNVFKMVGGKNTLVTSWCNSSQFQETVKLTNLSYRIKRGYFLQDLFPSSGLNEVCIPWCHADVTKCYYARTTPRFCARGLKTGLRKAFRLAIFVWTKLQRGCWCPLPSIMSSRTQKDRGQKQNTNQTILSELLKEEENRYCADCGAKGTECRSIDRQCRLPFALNLDLHSLVV